MLTARLSLKTWGGIMATAALAVPLIWEYGLHDYQRNRFLAFINPALDPASSWQPRTAMNAVGSGRFLGKGFLQATPIRLRSLPALWTDFPFAVLAEEWGFLGCFAVLVAYGFLILWILKIGREARDRFGATLCIGIAAMIFWQMRSTSAWSAGCCRLPACLCRSSATADRASSTVMTSLGLVPQRLASPVRLLTSRRGVDGGVGGLSWRCVPGVHPATQK